MKRLMSALLSLLAGAILALVAVPALPAQAGIWHEYPPAANRTCSDTRTYNGTAYQVCLEFNYARTQVRAIAFVNPGAYTNFQVNLRLAFGGGGPTITDSCPTMTTNASRACYTGFTALRRTYVVADADVGIAGSWMTPIRALDMQLSGKQQENSNWCGPAAAQTIIATMGVSAPSQSTLADKMETTRFGTMPWMMKTGINAYVPQDFPYKDYEAAADGLPRIRGLEVIVKSLSRGRPVAVLVKPGQLPWSPDAPGGIRHYIVIHGFGGHEWSEPGFWPWVPDNFKVWDPGTSREENLTVDQLYHAALGAELSDSIWAISS
ncbi:C39 family peptidase [Nonomuraea angiospora]|uniref:C39 family peptidase n=1 Tax=Nonomuraea angiospora TaxID=46172 RepID=UPI00344D6412